MHPNIIEYTYSKEIKGGFYELLCALYRQADSDNAAKIKQAWPEFAETFRKRYNAPGGALDDADTKWISWHYGIEEV